MKFVVKDLMITVLPIRMAEIGFRGGCDAGTSCACTGCTGCTGHTNETKRSCDCPRNIDPIEQLAYLKDQLRLELAAVEQQEAAMIESLRPRNAAEAKVVRSYLTDALEELDARDYHEEGKSQEK